MTLSDRAKQRHGTLRPSRSLPRVGGQALHELPKPPDDLTDAQAESWGALGNACIALGVLQSTDLQALEQAARAWGMAVELEAAARSEGLVVLGSQGQPRISPLLVEARAWAGLAAKLVRELGLSPKARGAVNVNQAAPLDAAWENLDADSERSNHGTS